MIIKSKPCILESKIKKKFKKKTKENNFKNEIKFPKRRSVEVRKISNNIINKNDFQRRNRKQSTIKHYEPPKKINSPKKKKMSVKSMKLSNSYKVDTSNKNLIPQTKNRHSLFQKRAINQKSKTTKVKKTFNKIINMNEQPPAPIANYQKFLFLNDEELNTLDYLLAIKNDKRTYFQYYWALLKKKQIIIFTFLPNNKDYNLITLKMSLFILSFSLYFTINGFFFSDATMHKLIIDNGKYNLLFRIPQIFYSSIISVVINKILKLLSLSEKDVIDIKGQNITQSKAIKISNEVIKYLMMKFCIFFVLCFSLMIFFWYFIGCFCAVYTNTQIVLIKDTIISFSISMLYPFLLNLIPGVFRIPALRNNKKDKKCLYRISQLISII